MFEDILNTLMDPMKEQLIQDLKCIHDMYSETVFENIEFEDFLNDYLPEDNKQDNIEKVLIKKLNKLNLDIDLE